MILSNKDIAELANDGSQTKLVRYLAKRIVNMHNRIAFCNTNLDAFAGALTHIASVSRKAIDDEAKKWKAALEANGNIEEDDDED